MELSRLARLPFFQGVPQWALVRLAEAAAEQEVPAGALVLRQADRARVVHVLLAGSVQVLLRVGRCCLIPLTTSTADGGHLVPGCVLLADTAEEALALERPGRRCG